MNVIRHREQIAISWFSSKTYNTLGAEKLWIVGKCTYMAARLVIGVLFNNFLKIHLVVGKGRPDQFQWLSRHWLLKNTVSVQQETQTKIMKVQHIATRGNSAITTTCSYDNDHHHDITSTHIIFALKYSMIEYRLYSFTYTVASYYIYVCLCM